MKRLVTATLLAFSLAVGCVVATESEQVQLTENSEALAAYERGLEAGQAGRHEEALRQFEAAIRHDPGFAEAQTMIGIALVSLGRAEDAIPHYREAIRLAPQLAGTWVSLASALSQVGQYEEGLEAYERAQELDPALAERYRNVGWGLRKQIATSMPIEEPPRPFELNGFAVMPPTGDRWRMNRGATREAVMFERSTGHGGDHTVFARAYIAKASSAAIDHEVFLRQTLDAVKQEFNELPRYTRLRLEFSDATHYGLTCLEYSFTVQDRGVTYAPGKEFVLSGSARGCLYPKSRVPLVLVLTHSQRHLKKLEPISLDAELRALFEEVSVLPPDTR